MIALTYSRFCDFNHNILFETLEKESATLLITYSIYGNNWKNKFISSV